jgi:HSP20 family protein
VRILSERKPPEKKSVPREKKETASPEKKEVAASRARRGPTEMVPYAPSDIWQDFDRIFDRFRRDFEDLLHPSEGPLMRAFPRMPTMKAKAPHVDLEDRGKDFLLTAEMPGFRKEDVDIKVQDNSVEIRGTAAWKHDDRTRNYVVKERAGESFYRMIRLPEEIRTEAVEAGLKDGVMEIILPKKTPRRWKKVSVK